MARKANVGDLFNIVRLLNELDMKSDIVSIYEGKGTFQEKGFDVIFKILNKASSKNIEKRVYDVLSGPFEMNPPEVEKIDIDTLIQLCKECFNLKTLINFIKRVSN